MSYNRIGSLFPYSQTISLDGSLLSLNPGGGTISLEGASPATNWSQFSAISDLAISNQNINGVNNINLQTINGAQYPPTISGYVSNPMTSNLSGGNYNITGVNNLSTTSANIPTITGVQTINGSAYPPAPTGVQTITAGTNISITGTAQNPTINAASTGVQTITAGTNISITGTAQNPTINATSVATGVQSLTAGSGIALTGTAQNPIVSTAQPGYNFIAFDGGRVAGGTNLFVGYATCGALDLTQRYLAYYSVIGTSGNPDVQVYLDPYWNQASTISVINSANLGGNNITVRVGLSVPPGVNVLPSNEQAFQLNPGQTLSVSYVNCTPAPAYPQVMVIAHISDVGGFIPT
jgi:hypothetical protein